MCSQIRLFENNAMLKEGGMIKIGKFVNFWAGNSCHLVRSMKTEYGNFSFSHDIILKAELYCYIYIVIFGKYLSELYWITLMCFYNPGQNIWYKAEKSRKVGQDFKSLLSNSASFLTAIVKV